MFFAQERFNLSKNFFCNYEEKRKSGEYARAISINLINQIVDQKKYYNRALLASTEKCFFLGLLNHQ